MPELRKRPAPKETATPAPAAKRSASKPRAGAGEKAKKVAGKAKDDMVGDGKKDGGKVENTQVDKEGSDVAATDANADAPVVEEKKGAASATTEEKSTATTTAGGEGVKGPLSSESVGKKVGLDGFGGTIKTHSGDDVTLSSLIGKSEKGVVLFTCELFPFRVFA